MNLELQLREIATVAAKYVCYLNKFEITLYLLLQANITNFKYSQA